MIELPISYHVPSLAIPSALQRCRYFAVAHSTVEFWLNQIGGMPLFVRHERQPLYKIQHAIRTAMTEKKHNLNIEWTRRGLELAATYVWSKVAGDVWRQHPHEIAECAQNTKYGASVVRRQVHWID